MLNLSISVSVGPGMTMHNVLWIYMYGSFHQVKKRSTTFGDCADELLELVTSFDELFDFTENYAFM